MVLPDGRLGHNGPNETLTPWENEWVARIEVGTPAEFQVRVIVAEDVVIQRLGFLAQREGRPKDRQDVWRIEVGEHLAAGSHQFTIAWDGTNTNGEPASGLHHLFASATVESDTRNPCNPRSGSGAGWGLGYLDVVTTDASCSASGMSAVLTDQPGMKAKVGNLRQAIVSAAVGCDIDRVAELALEGDSPFGYAVGFMGDPGEFWREAERNGQEPMRLLVCLLNLPFALTPPLEDGSTWYRWPTASEAPWDTLTEEDKANLRACIGEDAFYWAEMNSEYLGPRLSISDSADWLDFILAGD